MTDCSVHIFHSANVTLRQLQGWKSDCWNCGLPLSEHVSEVNEVVPPGQAFAINPEKIRPVSVVPDPE